MRAMLVRTSNCWADDDMEGITVRAGVRSPAYGPIELVLYPPLQPGELAVAELAFRSDTNGTVPGLNLDNRRLPQLMPDEESCNRAQRHTSKALHCIRGSPEDSRAGDSEHEAPERLADGIFGRRIVENPDVAHAGSGEGRHTLALPQLLDSLPRESQRMAAY